MFQKPIYGKLLALVLLLAAFGCNKNENFQTTPIPAQAVQEELGANSERLGAFVYHHIKYYMATVDPYSFIVEDHRDAFRQQFERALEDYQEKEWTHYEHLDHLAEQGVYSDAQLVVLKQQHQDLEDFLLNVQPDVTTAWNWMLQQEQRVKENEQLTEVEKTEILDINVVTRYLLKYQLENTDLRDLESLDGRASCNFWAQVFCYLGVAKDMLGLAANIVAGNVVGAIASAIGVAVGVYQAVTTCPCNTNVCMEFKGVSLPYTCYSTGDHLTFTGWGEGNITPSSYRFRYFKNDDWSYGSNFQTNVGSSSQDVLYGSIISANGVNSIGLTTENICSGIPKESDHGMWELSELGVPYGMINGDNYLSTSDANYYPFFNYHLSGPVEISNASYQWAIVPSGYPGYSATGTISGTGTYSTVTVDWDDTPGFATLKCTVSTPCDTRDIYLSVHIHQ